MMFAFRYTDNTKTSYRTAGETLSKLVDGIDLSPDLPIGMTALRRRLTGAARGLARLDPDSEISRALGSRCYAERVTYMGTFNPVYPDFDENDEVREMTYAEHCRIHPEECDESDELFLKYFGRDDVFIVRFDRNCSVEEFEVSPNFLEGVCVFDGIKAWEPYVAFRFTPEDAERAATWAYNRAEIPEIGDWTPEPVGDRFEIPEKMIPGIAKRVRRFGAVVSVLRDLME